VLVKIFLPTCYRLSLFELTRGSFLTFLEEVPVSIGLDENLVVGEHSERRGCDLFENVRRYLALSICIRLYKRGLFHDYRNSGCFGPKIDL
jgi:hypothetical protein